MGRIARPVNELPFVADTLHRTADRKALTDSEQQRSESQGAPHHPCCSMSIDEPDGIVLVRPLNRQADILTAL